MLYISLLDIWLLLVGNCNLHFYNLGHLWIRLKLTSVTKSRSQMLFKLPYLVLPSPSFCPRPAIPSLFKTQCLLMEITNQADLCGSLGGGVILFSGVVSKRKFNAHKSLRLTAPQNGNSQNRSITCGGI